MKRLQLNAAIWLPKTPEEIFPFFAKAGNLQLLTPPWLNFEILSAPSPLGEGGLIDYRLKLRGIPFRWRSRISAWEPPDRFVDEQVKGPYRAWSHEHLLRAGDGGTWMEDRVLYAVWGGAWVDRLLVRPDLERIFRYRAERVREIFDAGGMGPPASLRFAQKGGAAGERDGSSTAPASVL